LLLAVPAAAAIFRVTVHFAASFNLSGAPGTGVLADVGQITVLAPPTEFLVVPADGGGGVLKIHDFGTSVQNSLIGSFKTNFVGQSLEISWSMSASQDLTPFIVRAVDDSDAGMIDAGFGGNGMIVVGGQDVAPYEPGTTYDCVLSLFVPLKGPASWSVLVKAEDGSAADVTASGPLAYSYPLMVKSIHLVRPAGVPGGQFFLDDLKAVSSTASVVK